MGEDYKSELLAEWKHLMDTAPEPWSSEWDDWKAKHWRRFCELDDMDEIFDLEDELSGGDG